MCDDCGCAKEPAFTELSDEDKLRKIEQVLDAHVRPMLKQDGGGMVVKGLEGNALTIQYSGACGGCPHALTGTRMFIQRQLAQALGTDIEVEVVRA
ncbi:MAG: NifU family protein [Planctomycetota bacterium]